MVGNGYYLISILSLVCSIAEARVEGHLHTAPRRLRVQDALHIKKAIERTWLNMESLIFALLMANSKGICKYWYKRIYLHSVVLAILQIPRTPCSKEATLTHSYHQTCCQSVVKLETFCLIEI